MAAAAGPVQPGLGPDDFAPPSVPPIQCLLFPEHPSRCVTLAWLKFSMSIVSMLGSAFIIFIIWLFRKYEKTTTQRLILYLSISSFLSAIVNLLAIEPKPDNARHKKCITSAFLSTYFDWSILLWVLCITNHLVLKVRSLNKRFTPQEEEARKKIWEQIYLAISFLTPGIIASLPWIYQVYGHAGNWCWIPVQYNTWRFFIWYLWDALAIILLFVGIWYIRFELNLVKKKIPELFFTN